MDELSAQIRTYYDATTTVTDVRWTADVGIDERSGSRIPTTGVDGEDDAALDIRFFPLERTDHLDVATRGGRRSIAPRRQAWMVAAAVVAVLVGALAVATRSDDRPSTVSDDATPDNVSTAPPFEDATGSTQPDSRAVAREFVESYGSWPWNLDDALALAAPGADLSGLTGRTGTERDLASYAAWLEAIGFQQTLQRCGIVHSGAEAIVYRCPFEFQALASGALELGPYTGSYTVTVSDGEVSNATMGLDLEDFSPEVWEPFADWVAADYPGDLAAMYTDDDLDEAKTTEESIALWRRHTRERTVQTGIDYEAGDYLVSRHPMVVDGVAFSVSVPARGWEPYEGFLLSKSTHGPQGAEAVIFWSAFPDGDMADPCLNIEWYNPELGWYPSQIDVVAGAVAAAPGVDVRSGPAEVTIDGHPARHVALTVRERAGCDPGFFYNWKAQTGGAMWVAPQPGDTIDVWVVDVDGITLFIGGETHPDNLSPDVAEEIQQIVDSIRFE
jgi:hypothetical protein